MLKPVIFKVQFTYVMRDLLVKSQYLWRWHNLENDSLITVEWTFQIKINNVKVQVGQNLFILCNGDPTGTLHILCNGFNQPSFLANIKRTLDVFFLNKQLKKLQKKINID